MFKRSLLFIFVMIALLLSACGSGVQPTPTIDATELAYMVYSTQTAIAAASTVTAIAGQVATATPAPAETQPPAATNTPQPSPTPTASSTPTATTPPTASPTAITENCTNQAKFVEETIPDGSTLASKQAFVKTWTLQNTGSCTWTTDYKLVLVSAEAMGAPTSVPISQTVNANDTTVFSIAFTAPTTPGSYQSDWKLQSAAGTVFGVGKQADEPFWVQIKVVASVNDLGLGDPTEVERFDTENNAWYLANDDNLHFELKDGSLLMTALNPIGDQWRVNALTQAADLFVQADFTTGASCTAKNSYGLIIRTQADANGAYNSGYIFNVSCDGMYRLYRLDAGTYVGLINWTASPDIRSGPNADNRVSIWAKGGQIKLYVNGKQMAEISDSTHGSGQYGLAVRAEGEEDFVVAVKEIAYWEVK
jgi:hypothetical protein